MQILLFCRRLIRFTLSLHSLVLFFFHLTASIVVTFVPLMFISMLLYHVSLVLAIPWQLYSPLQLCPPSLLAKRPVNRKTSLALLFYLLSRFINTVNYLNLLGNICNSYLLSSHHPIFYNFNRCVA